MYFGAADRAADFFQEAGLGVPSNRNPVRGLCWPRCRSCPSCCSCLPAHAASRLLPTACAPWPPAPPPVLPPQADHFLHVINRDFSESGMDVEANIQALVKQYNASRIAAHVTDHVKVCRCCCCCRSHAARCCRPCSWPASPAAHLTTRLAALSPLPQELDASPGQRYEGPTTGPTWLYQTTVLTKRTFLNKCAGPCGGWPGARLRA